MARCWHWWRPRGWVLLPDNHDCATCHCHLREIPVRVCTSCAMRDREMVAA